MRRTFKLTILVLLALLLIPSAQAKKPKYQISLTIHGNTDTMMFMGHYRLQGNRVVDTAFRNKRGAFVFSSDQRELKPGLYFFANPKGTYVEFVVYNEKPFFTFETEERDWTSNMAVKGSEQNKFFFDFHRLNGELDKDLQQKRATLDSASYQQYQREKLHSFDSLKEAMINQHPGYMLSKMMLATKEVPTPAVDANGDSLTGSQMWDYFMSHYFDNTPLNDNMIINTPRAVFYDRVSTYVDKYMRNAPPEIIIPYLDTLIDRSKPAPDVFQWLVMHLTQKYLQSNIMVYDSIYVHLVYRYFASSDNFWSSPTNIEKELIRADKWSKLLVGKVAPELILFDTNHTAHYLHQMPFDYKLLIFWSPSCGHCKTVIPALYEKYLKYADQYRLCAYAILSEPDDHTRPLWKKFLAEHNITHPNWINLDGGEANVDWHQVYDITTTPQIYLLNKENKIVAKHLGAESFEQIFKAVVLERD